MYDKTVRRRRAVLGLLVVLSLGLVTASFGGSGGALRSVQRGVVGVLAPVQEGASRALKPVRDLGGWFSDTLDAKEERQRLLRERDALRRDVTALEGQARENRELRGLVKLDQAAGLGAYTPVTARVILRSPNLSYATLNVDKGSSAGVRVDQPVVNGAGLVGRVSEVWRGGAQVTLITDSRSGVTARTAVSNEPGLIAPAIGDPGELRLDFVPRGRRLRRGERVVTAGTALRAGDLESLFPPDILIGTVARIERRDGELEQRIRVRPAADLRRLDFVQVLITPQGARGARAAAP